MTIIVIFFYISSGFFWLLLLYHCVLAVAGIYERLTPSRYPIPERYPSVALLIPAYNESLVLADTLEAMRKLHYPGRLDIYVLNDGSTDHTAEIARFYAEHVPFIHCIDVPPGRPKGKARVLNYGISVTESDYVAVFDADNRPAPDCLMKLVHAALSKPKAVGAVGHVRTLNESRNFFTRCIALEFSTFQLLMQAGRWRLFRLGSLPGTVMIVRRDALVAAGGYDPNALAEDADLSISLNKRGGQLVVVPDAVSWEEEPETFSVWLRQRTRWMEGNFYLIAKSLRHAREFHGRAAIDAAQLLSIYILGVLMMTYSNICFLLGLTGLFAAPSNLPLLLFWFDSWFILFLQLLAAQMLDKPRFRAVDLAVALAMYFTYAQLWYLVLLRGAWRYQKRKRKPIVWDKTQRFGKGLDVSA